MKTSYFVLTLVLCGCTSPAIKQAESFDAANKDPVCARQCFSNHSACVGSAGFGQNRRVANDVLQTCNAVTAQCLSTCPAK